MVDRYVHVEWDSLTGRTKGSRNITRDRAKWATKEVSGWSGYCEHERVDDLYLHTYYGAPIGPSLGTGNYTH